MSLKICLKKIKLPTNYLKASLTNDSFFFKKFRAVVLEKLKFTNCLGGRNSSVGSVWARCPQRRGFAPPLGTFSGRGDFSLGVNMGSNSIPQKTLSDESINRGLVCAHMHFIARTQKILTFMS